jgi:hypothetical protein
MTSISSIQSNLFLPRTNMDSRISAAVSAGTISSVDQTALESALNSIDSSMAATRTSGAKPSGDMKSRIDDLIGQQVTAGTLTDDQAKELKAFFAEGPKTAGDAQAAGGPGAMGGPGGPPPPPPSDTDSDDDITTSTAEDTTKQIDALMAFLQTLRETVASGLYGTGTSASTSNSANGSASGSNSSSGLLIDTNA